MKVVRSLPLSCGLILAAAPALANGPPPLVATEAIAITPCEDGEPATSLCLTATGSAPLWDGSVTYTRHVVLKDSSNDAVGGCDAVALTTGTFRHTGGRFQLPDLPFAGVGTYCKTAVEARPAGSARYELRVGPGNRGGSLTVSPPTEDFTDTATFAPLPPPR